MPHPLALGLILALLAGCAAGEGNEPPVPLPLRVLCTVERWIESGDSRVRQDGVDRCSGAARQIEASREQARQLLDSARDPNAGSSEGLQEN